MATAICMMYYGCSVDSGNLIYSEAERILR